MKQNQKMVQPGVAVRNSICCNQW